MAEAAADARTAMTIDFLRARLLSERSVSRAAKERADHLARRVAELEEQLRTVTAQRRRAERAAAEVLAILDSQGFGRLSDADDSGSDDEADTGGPGACERGGGGNAGRKTADDALSGSELGGQAAAPPPGALSWKGRTASPDRERRRQLPQQQHKGRQLRQRHGHGHRRGYFYSRAADSAPKYHPGQSCRKIKRKELRSQTEGEEGRDNAAESTEEGQERSDCTVCTDEQPDLDGGVSQDGRGSCGDGGAEDDGEYVKDGEMERVLEKQAELIGQFEAEENAQREWEKKFSVSRDSTVDDADLDNKLTPMENACTKRGSSQITGTDGVCDQARSCKKILFGSNSSSECLSKDSVSGSPLNAAEESAIECCKVNESYHDFRQNTTTVDSIDVKLHVRKDELVNKSCHEIVEGSGNNIRRSASSPQRSCDSSPSAGHNEGQGGESSDSGSNYQVNFPSSKRCKNAPSVGSPLSDTPKSEVSKWSSSCFHDNSDNQLDTQLYQPSSDDVEGVLEALQLAKMSLREKLSRPNPPCQNMLALPAPEDRYTIDDLPVNDTQLSISMSRPLRQEILTLSAPADYLKWNLPQNDVNVPVGTAGLFRLPTDSFPRIEMASSGSRFSLTSTNRLNISSSYHANNTMSMLSFSQYGSGFSMDPYYDRHSSMLLPVPSAGGSSIPVSDLRIGAGSFLPEISRPTKDLGRGVPPGGVSFQCGGD
ncbi:hypothetical protein ACP70R_040275 [Stipagrostis hirtigluma subsp. patula]